MDAYQAKSCDWESVEIPPPIRFPSPGPPSLAEVITSCEGRDMEPFATTVFTASAACNIDSESMPAKKVWSVLLEYAPHRQGCSIDFDTEQAARKFFRSQWLLASEGVLPINCVSLQECRYWDGERRSTAILLACYRRP